MSDDCAIHHPSRSQPLASIATFDSQRNHVQTAFTKWLWVLPLLFAVYQTVTILSSFGVSWQQVEVENWKPQILVWGFPHSLSGLLNALDWPMFEYEPRMTRPLSNLFEIIDTPFRAMLWQYIPLLPSFSLTWFFSLIIAPSLLFLFLRRLNVDTWIAVLAVSLYVTNPGILSLEAMLFRPGKALANTAILWCLWLAAKQDASRRQNVTASHLDFRFVGLCIAVYVSLFLDEVALIIYPALLLLFPRLVFRSKTSVVQFACIPLGYIAAIKWGIPALSDFAGYKVPHTYGPEDTMAGLINFSRPAHDYVKILKGILPNMAIILSDSFGLIRPDLPHSIYYWCLFVIIVGLGSVFLIKLAFRLWRDRAACLKEMFTDSSSAMAWRATLALLSAFIYEALLMAVSASCDQKTVSHCDIIVRVWGLYYYGVFCVIFLVIALALLARSMRPPRTLAIIFALAVIGGTTWIFPATNQVYKNAHYYPRDPGMLTQCFKNKFDRFDVPRSDSAWLKSKTIELWQSRTTHRPVRNVPLELSFILYELKFLLSPLPCKHHYFDLTWVGDKAQASCHDGDK